MRPNRKKHVCKLCAMTILYTIEKSYVHKNCLDRVLDERAKAVFDLTDLNTAITNLIQKSDLWDVITQMVDEKVTNEIADHNRYNAHEATED